MQIKLNISILLFSQKEKMNTVFIKVKLMHCRQPMLLRLGDAVSADLQMGLEQSQMDGIGVYFMGLSCITALILKERWKMSKYVDVDRIDWRLIIPTNPTIAEEHIIHLAKTLVERQPTADVVEVVRCKDCKHKEHCCLWSIAFGDIDFCSYGERKDDKD